MAKKGVTSQGRRKIEIKKIQNEDARHVCFSKRKAGIFAKASDISTLCGADVALVVYSPAGNPYSFGSPAVDPVVDRFLSASLIHGGSAHDVGRSHLTQQLNQQYMEVSKQLEASKARKMILQERLAGVVQSQEIEWAKNNIDHLGLEQLERLKDAFERLKGRADARIQDILGTGQRMALHQPQPPPPSMMGFGVPPGGTGMKSDRFFGEVRPRLSSFTCRAWLRPDPSDDQVSDVERVLEEEMPLCQCWVFVPLESSGTPCTSRRQKSHTAPFGRETRLRDPRGQRRRHRRRGMGAGSVVESLDPVFRVRTVILGIRLPRAPPLSYEPPAVLRQGRRTGPQALVESKAVPCSTAQHVFRLSVYELGRSVSRRGSPGSGTRCRDWGSRCGVSFHPSNFDDDMTATKPFAPAHWSTHGPFVTWPSRCMIPEFGIHRHEELHKRISPRERERERERESEREMIDSTMTMRRKPLSLDQIRSNLEDMINLTQRRK
ncbi:unnamed protein product [Musa banksii]